MLAHAVDDALDLRELAGRIRGSSNFRFAWRFFSVDGCDLRRADCIWRVLSLIVEAPALHSFLRDTVDDIYPRTFTIDQLHEHCAIESSLDDFLDTIARAANDHLGAYSRALRPSTFEERQAVAALFGSIGDFVAFGIGPGADAECNVCQQYNHQLFSSWFFGVAWDFTFFVTWPKLGLLWMGFGTSQRPMRSAIRVAVASGTFVEYLPSRRTQYRRATGC
ncbi:MAG: hypothetical protein ACYC0X_29450 [Pirellulaceae bacterium]